MRNRYAIAFAVVLGSCATAQDVDRAKDSWQGATYEELLRAWGAPTGSTTTADGRYWYTWVTESHVQPQSSVGVGIGGFRIGGSGGTGVGVGVSAPVGSPPPPARCERTMVFFEGRVVEQYWQGPPSLCADLKHP